ncbi:hypothetical protein D6D19_06983 [Aureobasidium pullulans]|uniref:AMP-activated protein kinase glycogen-binding domain-containing protein n=1 Tax=Aureobasidium pullulans TaxID=5580 RepID=A0A4S8ZZC8_AURPU|nr:hypothetical protein D6D19_06983 [Aureobasidium pullulans]
MVNRVAWFEGLRAKFSLALLNKCARTIAETKPSLTRCDRDHPAQEVYVTGDFDNWSKSIKLNKNGDSFHKTVTIPGEEHRVHYKFVVDGQWTTDWTAKQETDSSGNVNNVVEARELSPEPEERPAQAFISSVHPQSTTAAFAGEVPLEKERNAHSEQSVDETTFPQETPGFEDLPGQFPVTPMADLKQFTVNPIPATDGPSNPVKLAPGEPVPHPSTLTSNTIQSTVRDDPELKKATSTFNDGANESRERELTENDLPGAYAPSTAREEKEDTKAFGINPIPATAGIGNPIKLAPGEPVPHHSKITSNTIQSTVRDGSQYGVSDTGAPVLPPVLDSQSEAEANGASMFNLPSIGGNMIPESSLPMGGDSQLPNFDNAFSSSVAPQSTTAQLAGQVPREPRGVPEVVSESQESAHVSPEASSSAKAVQSKHNVEEELKEKVPEANASAESGPVTGVPEVVTDSQHAAHTGPEAAANPEAVREKAAVESELKQTIPEENATSQRSPVADAAPSEPTIDGSVPEVVTESQERAHVQPEASASPEAVREKTAMEGELLSEVSKAPATSESGILGKSEQGITDKATAGVAAASAAVSTQANKAYESVAPQTQSLTGSSGFNQRSIESDAASQQVPEVVHESQERAHVDPEASANPEAVHEKHDMETHVAPEASANPEAVHEKHDMESELLSHVHKAPATSESGALGTSERGISGKATAGIAAGTAALGATAAGVAYTARDKAAEATGRDANTILPSSIQSAIENMNQGLPPTNSSLASPATHSSVPEAVLDSQHQAHVGPEASAQPEAATTEAGAFTENTGLSGATTSATPIYNEETSAIAASTGLNAPADSQAQIPAPKSEQLAAPTLAAPTEQSRDVSPMTRPDSSKQSEPQVTTGTETHTVPATTGSAPTTPQRHATKRSSGFFRGTPQSDRTSVAGSSKVDEDGKPKKKGFLAKLKEKFRG